MLLLCYPGAKIWLVFLVDTWILQREHRSFRPGFSWSGVSWVLQKEPPNFRSLRIFFVVVSLPQGFCSSVIFFKRMIIKSKLGFKNCLLCRVFFYCSGGDGSKSWCNLFLLKVCAGIAVLGQFFFSFERRVFVFSVFFPFLFWNWRNALPFLFSMCIWERSIWNFQCGRRKTTFGFREQKWDSSRHTRPVWFVTKMKNTHFQTFPPEWIAANFSDAIGRLQCFPGPFPPLFPK